MQVTPALSSFLRELAVLEQHGDAAACVAHLERLVEGAQLPEVAAALGASTERDVSHPPTPTESQNPNDLSQPQPHPKPETRKT